MSGKSISEFGKNVSEDFMTTIALKEAFDLHDELMDLEYKLAEKGRKDKESAIRSRLSEKIGVPVSYLFRLAHKRSEMRDVAGEVYRLLKVGRDKYMALCQRNEAAAAAYRAERLELKEKRNVASEVPTLPGVGTAASGMDAKRNTPREAVRR